ncbi:MAG: hypothetical protein SNJ72_10480 [Fimbriimonadales bacterium]
MSYQDPAVPNGLESAVADQTWTLEEVASSVIATSVALLEAEEQAVEEMPPSPEMAEIPKPPIKPFPKPPRIPIARRLVSGRYRGRLGYWELELRVDVDGRRPLQRVSGDFYMLSGATRNYFGSFIVNSVHLAVSATRVVITGRADTSWTTPYRNIRLVIPRVPLFRPPADAALTFLTDAGAEGVTYVCSYESNFFRAVQLEVDCVAGVTAFDSYNTGSLPSGGTARVLSVPEAFREAGIDMQVGGAANVVPLSGAGANAKWSDAELHDAMETHFSLWHDVPQWKVWLLAAYEHELGPSLLGIMFDQKGRQRQGCAVFHRGIGGVSAEQKRLQLYTYVHELGHCFNLLHSWQKQYATPSAPNRPASLSWMNYPWRFPGGPSAFWSAFPFQFDDLEVIHLRHAFRNHVVPGGSDFTVGSALEDPQMFASPISDQTGLKLEIETRRSYALGEPVVVEIKLYSMSLWEKQVDAPLHPQGGFVQIAIRKPNGEITTYKPAIEHCILPETTLLDERHPSLYESAYIGFGKDGLYFDQPGRYQLRAIYYALDGSVIASNIQNLIIHSPISSTDQTIAELLMDEQVGMLFSLLGSDSLALQRGNEALQTVLENYPKHPLANYARLAKGINASREFKVITADNRITVRAPRYDEAVQLLEPVVDFSEKDPAHGLDNISLGMTMLTLASAHKASGQDKEANATAKRMVTLFSKRIKRKHVLDQISAQASTI